MTTHQNIGPVLSAAGAEPDISVVPDEDAAVLQEERLQEAIDRLHFTVTGLASRPPGQMPATGIHGTTRVRRIDWNDVLFRIAVTFGAGLAIAGGLLYVTAAIWG